MRNLVNPFIISGYEGPELCTPTYTSFCFLSESGYKY